MYQARYKNITTTGQFYAMTINAKRDTLNRFFAEKERRALSMAEFAVGSRDDALDIVQDAMIRFASRYVKKPENEWAPLFHRVLQSRIQDFYRKTAVKNKYFGWLPVFRSDDDAGYDVDPIQQAPDLNEIDQARLLDSDISGESVQQAVRQLPARQQQAFLLRCWEGLDTKATAKAMKCSEGSVKTHYSRALSQLKKTLQNTYNEHKQEQGDFVASENTHEANTA